MCNTPSTEIKHLSQGIQLNMCTQLMPEKIIHSKPQHPITLSKST